MNGRTRYLQFLKAHVGPGLRVVGFRGSGQNYQLADSPGHALLGFQGERWSDEGAYGFTVNVAFYSAEGWQRQRQVQTCLPDKPSPSVVYGFGAAAGQTPGGWWERLGGLTPLSHDHWWGIDATTDPAALAVEVLEAIRGYALPALEAAGPPPYVPGDSYSRRCGSRFCYEGTRQEETRGEDAVTLSGRSGVAHQGPLPANSTDPKRPGPEGRPSTPGAASGRPQQPVDRVEQHVALVGNGEPVLGGEATDEAVDQEHGSRP